MSLHDVKNLEVVLRKLVENRQTIVKETDVRGILKSERAVTEAHPCSSADHPDNVENDFSLCLIRRMAGV